MLKASLLFLAAGAAMGENWPRFRGPTGQGLSTETGLPIEWNEHSNVAWRTAIPGKGWSSPILWGDRVFLTTATGEDGSSCHVISVDRRSGAILWDREVFRQSITMNRRQNSFATSTPVTDGKRVYAVFASGWVAAVDFDGEVAWTNKEFAYYSEHGLGASPVLYKNLLIMQYDGSSRGEDKKVGWQKPWDQSFLAAFDTSTGKVRWKMSRGMSRIGHVTPNILVENGVAQLVSGAGDVVQGYDPFTGERIWTAYSQGEGVVPSIVLGDGLIFTSSGFEKSTIRALRTGGRGDVTKTHIAWEQTKGVPRIPSFVYVKPYLFTITETGVAMCLKADSGEIVWQERVGGNFWSSPVVAEGRIYFLNEECETTVIRAAAKFEVLARNPLPGPCQASMAVSGRRFFLRTATHLYALGGARP